MNGLDSSVRLLFRSALVIFAVTIVIGILNGMDIWEPSHNMLLTHVHSGTLGWITLAVFGAALLMFDEGRDAEVPGVQGMATFAVVATVLYVIAFGTTTGIMRPITGTLMLAAIVWVLVWTARQYGSSAKSTAQLGTLLAIISLTIGAILGVLLGVFVANGEIPGLDTETAGTLAGAHPPAMLIGYLILAGAAINHWLLGASQSRPGRWVMIALFTAGLVTNISFIFEVDALVQVATLLEVAAIVTFAVHVWPQLRAWANGGADNFARASVVFLGIGIVLLVYVVQLIVSGTLDPATGEGPEYVLLAFDHAMFIGVMTNALFALVARTGGGLGDSGILAVVNGGLAIFLVGLVTDTTILKRIGAPVMGLALLYAIFVFFGRLAGARAATVG